jgi:hypothetical protein
MLAGSLYRDRERETKHACVSVVTVKQTYRVGVTLEHNKHHHVSSTTTHEESLPHVHTAHGSVWNNTKHNLVSFYFC